MAAAAMTAGCAGGTSDSVRNANKLTLRIAPLKDAADDRLDRFQEAEGRYLDREKGALAQAAKALRDESAIVGQIQVLLASYPVELPDWFRSYLRTAIQSYDRYGRAVSLLTDQARQRARRDRVAGLAPGGSADRLERLADDAVATYGRRAFAQLEAARRLGQEADHIYRDEVRRNGLRSLKVPSFASPVP